MSQSNLLARKNFSEYIDNHQWFKRHRLTPILATELEKKIFEKMSESGQFYIDPKSLSP